MKKYFFLFTICFTIFIVHLLTAGHGIYGDGNGYYSYSNAIYFEKSLNFDPIYSHLSNFHGKKYIFSRIFWDTSYGPLSIRKNVFPIGTGLIWIPSLALISLLESNKFSLLFEIGPGLTGILLTLSGLFFLEKYLRNFFSEKVAVFATLFFFFTSNLFYYASFEPALSHQPAFFIISFLLWKTYKMKDTFLNYFFVGALSGLLFITRIPDSILLIPIYWQILSLKPKRDHFIIAPVSAFLFSLPLFVSYYLMFGNPIHMPYLTGESGTFTFSFTKILEFFLSAKRGLFIWTPIYLFGLIGLFNARKYSILTTLTLLFLVSSFWSANTSAGFGQRFVLSGVPYFAFGIARLIKNVNSKYMTTLFLILLTWNFLTLFQFYFDSKNLIKNESLTLKEFVRGQFKAPFSAIDIVKKNGIHYFLYNHILD